MVGWRADLDFGDLDLIFKVTARPKLPNLSKNTACYLMSILLGHDEELIRFWWPWLNFQGHYKSALYELFGNLCIVMQMKIGFLII